MKKDDSTRKTRKKISTKQYMVKAKWEVAVLFYDFQIEYIRHYVILRDYHVKHNDNEGILFILADKKTGEIIRKIVYLDDIDNDGEWQKTKVSKQADFIKVVVEQGEENIMIEEIGKVKKKGMFDKEIKVDVKQYRYYLKRKN